MSSKDNQNDRENAESKSSFDTAAELFIKSEGELTELESQRIIQELENDPELLEEVKEFSKTKHLFKQLPPEFVDDILGEEERKPVLFAQWSWQWGVGLAACLLLIMSIAVWIGGQNSGSVDVVETRLTSENLPTTEILPDGSLLRLNSNALLEVSYTKDLRRVNLVRGEAHFNVSSDELRPFIVNVGGVNIQAVGTAFNIKWDEQIDVIVTEGTVLITTEDSGSIITQVSEELSSSYELGFQKSEGFLSQGQRAEILILPESKQPTFEVFTADTEEVDARLSWQASLLTLTGDTLSDIASSFQQKTGYRLIITDPALNDLRIGGRFPSSDVFDFLRILEVGYGIPWQQTDEGVFMVGDLE